MGIRKKRVRVRHPLTNNEVRVERWNGGVWRYFTGEIIKDETLIGQANRAWIAMLDARERRRENDPLCRTNRIGWVHIINPRNGRIMRLDRREDGLWWRTTSPRRPHENPALIALADGAWGRRVTADTPEKEGTDHDACA